MEWRVSLDSSGRCPATERTRKPHLLPIARRHPLVPGGISESEILVAYGATSFSSRMGQLAGNHFLTIVDGNENLAALGDLVLWEGAQDILFEAA